MMLTVIVSEKGGGSKNVNSQKTEINIGRVQGNDVVLPKGNVSKRHARIVAKDGKVILVDLQSTNGTYVNGRKISSPIVITPRDKIYIGDFILQLSPAAGSEASESSLEETPSPESSTAPPPAQESKQSDGESSSKRSHKKATRPASKDDSSESADLPVDGRPRDKKHTDSTSGANQKEGQGQVKAAVIPVASQTVMGQPGPQKAESAKTDLVKADRVRAERSAQTIDPVPLPEQLAAPVKSTALPKPGASLSSVSDTPANEDLNVRALRVIRADIAQQVERFRSETGEIGDDLIWEKTENAIVNAVDRLKASDRISSDIDEKGLVRRALHEILGWGIIGELLEDEKVIDIFVNRWDHVLVRYRNEGQPTLYKGCFSSEVALSSAVSRMIDSQLSPSQDTLPFYRCRLPGDIVATVVSPPIAHAGMSVVVSRATHSKLSLADLKTAKKISPSTETSLKNSISSGKRILVASPSFHQQDFIAKALLSEIGTAERLMTVESVARLMPDSPNWLRLETSALVCRGSIEDIDVMGIANAMMMRRLFVEVTQKSTLLSLCCVSGELKSGMIASVEAPDSAGIFDYLALKYESDHLARLMAANFDLLVFVREKKDAKLEVQVFDIKLEGAGKPRLIPSS